MIKGIVNVEECVLLEGLREHADMLEVNNSDTASRDIDNEIIVADVGVID